MVGEVVIDPDPLMPEEMEKAIRQMPSDAEVIDLLKNFPERVRFLRDNCKGREWSMAARHRVSKILAGFLSAA